MEPRKAAGSPKVIFFDVNDTLLDLAPLEDSISRMLGGRSDMPPLWFASLLHYSLVVTVSDRYRSFTDIGVAVLRMIAAGQGIRLSQDEARRALAPMGSLPPHPDVVPALERLKQAGFRLAVLSNSPQTILEAQLNHAGLSPYFDTVLSVETVAFFKPHPHTYRWAAWRMGVEIADGLMVAAHGWDVAGALWAGMRAVFVQRSGQPMFPLAKAPECRVPTFTALADYLLGASRAGAD